MDTENREAPFSLCETSGKSKSLELSSHGKCYKKNDTNLSNVGFRSVFMLCSLIKMASLLRKIATLSTYRSLSPTLYYPQSLVSKWSSIIKRHGTTLNDVIKVSQRL